MTLLAGSRLGPYEIPAPIGAGGMGEVYKARDTRLDRTVAVKVLPSSLASSAEVRQRFEREAKTISQLSHPHICALYDVGNQDGVEYLVMEYLEGETLASRLVKGALPLEQTLRYGVEIADALDKAHRQGVVHRDLKPGNVMLTTSGVKLLDFGLAKALAPVSSPSSLTAFPTEAPALTAEGTLLGTLQYMAPEQLEGKEADARTDIFAFGAVLYEMATGRKAFSGASQASLISAIMSSEPPSLPTLQPMTPPALDRIVKTCLAKDPEDRWQTLESGNQKFPDGFSRDGRFLLYEEFDHRTNRDIKVLPLAGDRQPRAFIATPFDECSAQFSPDGRWVAYVSDEPGRPEIYLAAFPEGARRRVSTEGGSEPKWSADGRELFYIAPGRKLTAVSVETRGAEPVLGQSRTLFQMPPLARGGTAYGRPTHYDVSPDGRFLVHARLAEEAPLPITLVLNWTAGLGGR